MADPSLYLDAITKLGKVGCVVATDSEGDHKRRCRSLEAALGWIVFVLGVAGTSRAIAAAACNALVNASFGYCSECDVCPDIMRRMLDAAGSVLTAMEQHPGDGGVIRNCVVFINNLALGDDAVVEELVALGADALVASAMAAHPGNTDVQSCGAAFLLRKQRSSTSV